MSELAPSPPPARIQQLRHHLGLTQADFGLLTHSKWRTVQDWEAGRRAMHPAMWELALIKAERIKPLPEVWV
jgi:DNA-binding transcriptional regulator YiaG